MRERRPMTQPSPTSVWESAGCAVQSNTLSCTIPAATHVALHVARGALVEWLLVAALLPSTKVLIVDKLGFVCDLDFDADNVDEFLTEERLRALVHDTVKFADEEIAAHQEGRCLPLRATDPEVFRVRLRGGQAELDSDQRKLIDLARRASFTASQLVPQTLGGPDS
ncbi:hypothetical protein OAX78_00415 [Planctomycetota bacterium]|nr:hypothetical protein [Planctomycetota bacterium]